MKVKRITERERIAKIAELEERVATQSRVIMGAAKDCTRSGTAAAAAFQLAAAAEFLIQGGMPRAALHVLSAMQFVENEYQNDTKAAATERQSAAKEPR